MVSQPSNSLPPCLVHGCWWANANLTVCNLFVSIFYSLPLPTLSLAPPLKHFIQSRNIKLLDVRVVRTKEPRRSRAEIMACVQNKDTQIKEAGKGRATAGERIECLYHVNPVYESTREEEATTSLCTHINRQQRDIVTII